MTPTDDLHVSDRALPTARPDPANGPENGVVRHLVRHGPATGAALPTDCVTNSAAREVVAKLDVARGNANGPMKRRGSTTSVYYLYGEERVAVRRFIDENAAYVASCLRDRHSPLHEHDLYEVFVEEWVWRDWRDGGGEADGE